MDSLARERAHLLNPLVPWYNNERETVKSVVPFGQMMRMSGPPLQSSIHNQNTDPGHSLLHLYTFHRSAHCVG